MIEIDYSRLVIHGYGVLQMCAYTHFSIDFEPLLLHFISSLDDPSTQSQNSQISSPDLIPLPHNELVQNLLRYNT